MQPADKIKIEKKYKILIIVSCILPVIIMFIYGNFIVPTKRESFIKSELKCSVVDKYINQNNHNTRTISIKENKNEAVSELILHLDTLLYNYVIPGDTIIKITNQDFVVVKRQDCVRKFIVLGDGWLEKN